MADIPRTIIPHWLFDHRPRVAIIVEEITDPDGSLNVQVGLTCGHYTNAGYRFCPHCGAAIVYEDEVSSWIVKKAKHQLQFDYSIAAGGK